MRRHLSISLVMRVSLRTIPTLINASTGRGIIPVIQIVIPDNWNEPLKQSIQVD